MDVFVREWRDPALLRMTKHPKEAERLKKIVVAKEASTKR